MSKVNSSAITGGLISDDHQPGEMTPAKVAKDFQPPKPNMDEGLDFLLKLVKRLEKEDEVTDRQFHQKWLKVSKFYEGEHLGRFDAQGQWRSYTPQMGDPYFVHPEMRFHSDAITAAWTQSRPDIRVLPASDDDRTVSAARKASQILQHYEDTLLTEEFLQREGKLGQFTGQMYRYTYWEPKAGPKTKRYDFLEQEFVLDDGMFECRNCAYVGLPKELEQTPNCPYCGASSEALEITPPTQTTSLQPQEVGEFPIGDIQTECVPAFQVKVDRAQGVFQRAMWLRRRRMLRPEILKSLFPNFEPARQSTAGDSSTDFSIRAERLLQQSAGAAGRSSRADALTNPYAGVVTSQWWLVPEMYASRGPEIKPLEFAAITIPAGVRLIDLFPNGLYLLVAGYQILDVREEFLHDHWQHSPFILIPTRIEGDGIEDLLEVGRELDDLMSLVYIDAKSNSAPPTIINSMYGLKTSDIAGKPHWVVPARVPTGEDIKNSIYQIPGRGLPYSVFQYIQMLRGEQQLLAKTFSPMTGAPDEVTNGMSMSTATSAQLTTSAAQGQRAPELAIRAFGTLTWARQVLRLFQKNAIDQHYIPLSGRFGTIEGNRFKGADIDADFALVIRSRSWIPRDEFSRRNDLLGAIQAGLFNPQLPRAVREQIAEVFNVEVGATPEIQDARLARIRLDKMKEMLEQLEPMLQAQPELTMVVPQLLLQAAPLVQVSDNHPVMSEWYKDWLKFDEGLASPVELREAVIGRIQEHDQASALEVQRQQALQMQAMAPQLAMQQSEQQHQMQSQMQMQAVANQSKSPPAKE